ncbi:MAG: hypothetical protein KF799_07405 [Bdellovibrionales bacterium]|nr:hypothetical protein [Bdellovibrionales bacterium]
MREFKPERVPRPQHLDVAPPLPPTLDLEIGAGRGLHAIQYCTRHPERTLLAVERTHAKFAGLEQRKQAHPELEGLIILQADAISVVTHLLKTESLERVFLLYPNPYPKTKHANLRWHNSPFLSQLKQKMKPGAELTLATNLEWYATEAAERLAEVWGFRLLEKRQLGVEHVDRTHFERKYRARGETCFDLKFTLDS